MIRLSLALCTVSCCFLASSYRSLAGEPLIATESSAWRYLDEPVSGRGRAYPEGWNAPGFDDSSWAAGEALLGYGDADVRTRISFGNNPQRKRSCALFRRRFRLANCGRVRLLRARICCDDGAVVFLNGQEVYRYNMPSGSIGPTSHALVSIGPELNHERRRHPFSIPPECAVEGENVIAISVHQANSTSSDLALDFELSALTNDQEATDFQREVEASSSSASETRQARLTLTNPAPASNLD